MKIFLTGGTGFIGSHVLKQLLALDIEVIAHRRKESSSPNIPIDSTVNWLTKPVSDIEPLDFTDVDVLLHLASHSVQYPFDTLENNIHFNVVEPLKMFEKANQAGVTKYVVAGSCFEYGRSGERYEYIPIDAPLEPTNDYATSKAMSFLAFRQFALNKGVSLSYQRIFHAFGEGQPKNRLWPSIKNAALEGKDLKLTPGEQIRDFVPVEEVTKKLIMASSAIKDLDRVILVENIGSGSPQSISEFTKYWWGFWRASGTLKLGALPYRDREVMRFVPEI
jgi:nucleoside-diphosphate-sugar epimerase